MLTVMAKSKSKEKKGKRAKLSKVRKKGSRKKKDVTAKARKGAKKNAAGRKATPRPKVTHAETTTSAPAAFTEIASEEMTSSPPSPGEPAMIESTGASESGFTPTEDNSNSNNTSSM
jgi:hypothetical protein